MEKIRKIRDGNALSDYFVLTRKFISDGYIPGLLLNTVLLTLGPSTAERFSESY